MEGLVIKKAIEEGSKVNSLNLLMSHKKLEVIYGHIPAKGGFIISSYKNDEIIEFIYIIDGELQYDDDGETVILKSGDCFYQNKLEKCFTMYAITESKIITFSNTGEFNEVDNSWNSICKAIGEVEEKDNYTKGHCMRVGLYAQKLAN